MLSVWWDVKGIIYWELLPDGCTVIADLYCQQLGRVAQKLNGKQDRVCFLHDNARPHVAYSPDLAPAAYYLFRSFSNRLREKKFDDESNLKTNLADFFSQKSLDF